MLELDPNPKPTELNANVANEAEANSTTHGTVESCQFEELLERAMEILRTRRATAGSLST
jgi:hypothetical protein